MPSFRLTRPKIAWGPALANTLRFGYPLDGVSAGDDPRAGSETTQAPSGVEEAWSVGTDYTLTGDARYIPPSDTGSPDPVATGWDGATGFRAFLAWARDKNAFEFFPDDTDAEASIANCYLVEPMKGQGTSESDGTRRVTLTIRNASTPFDGY